MSRALRSWRCREELSQKEAAELITQVVGQTIRQRTYEAWEYGRLPRTRTYILLERFLDAARST